MIWSLINHWSYINHMQFFKSHFKLLFSLCTVVAYLEKNTCTQMVIAQQQNNKWKLCKYEKICNCACMLCINMLLCMQIFSLWNKLLWMLHSLTTSSVQVLFLYLAYLLLTCCIWIVHVMQLLCVVHPYQHYDTCVRYSSSHPWCNRVSLRGAQAVPGSKQLMWLKYQIDGGGSIT